MGNKFIVIIDEWDALFREAKKDAALQKEYLQLLRSLFKSSLTDRMIEAAYITGILPIKKYGTQSALTDFDEYTMLQPEPLERYVGFTENEVRDLCAESELSFAAIQNWYDGYLLGNSIHIYSPKSVLDALKRNRLGSYWTQTETYESLKFYIEMDEFGLKEAVVQMLGGAHYPIDTGTFQNDMTNINCMDDVLTLLVHLGYLAYDADDRTVFIPNKEVKQEFVRAITSGKHKEFAYISCVDEYLEIEELPSGTGYADVVYFPKKDSALPILLIELKWNKTADGAIDQIKSRNYPQILENAGKEILLVGINYDVTSKKHTCIIEKYRV